MHPRNLHKDGYPIGLLCQSYPPLKSFVVRAKSGKESIDFSNADAVLALNTALLKHYYNVSQWQLPKGYLCPPVPGRADYIHGIADLLSSSPKGQMNQRVCGLDIGIGANAIYPIVGISAYNWQFVGSDIDDGALANARKIAAENKGLSASLSLRKQTNKLAIFNGVIKPDDYFTFTMCNPPFHKSAKEALAGTQRKTSNLAKNKQRRGSAPPKLPKGSANLNFAGNSNELWCEGGELAFIQRMIKESTQYKTNVGWFTCLVSKSAHLKPLETSIRYYEATAFTVIEMGQGNKISRFIAWSFQ